MAVRVFSLLAVKIRFGWTMRRLELYSTLTLSTGQRILKYRSNATLEMPPMKLASGSIIVGGGHGEYK